MTNELEPCPFCGGEAQAVTIDKGQYQTRVECTECKCSLGYHRSRSCAIDAWNTRYKRTCKWNIKHSGTLYDVYQCSACGYEYAESRTDHGIKVELCDAKFCPNCGAEVVDGD